MKNIPDKNLRNKKTFFLDRFPYIIFLVVIVVTIVIFFNVINRFPMSFFSNTETTVQEENKYDLYIASPSKDQQFDLVNTNETISFELKAKDLDENKYLVNVFVNNEKVKTFSSQPYTFEWSPPQTGTYDLYAEIVDEDNNVIYASEKMPFTVNFKEDIATESTTFEDVNLEEKKNDILSNSKYRSQNGEPIFSLKAYTPPVIDGSVDEWAVYEKFTSFNPTIKKENFVSAQDVSGIFYTSWDDKNFYFLIKVTDDVYNQPYNLNQIDKGDCVVLVFDAELENDFTIPFLNGDDYQFEFSAGNNSQSPAESYARWPTNAPVQGAVIAAKKGSGGYTIEASIPWFSMTSVEVKDGLVMGFTVSIMDTDNLETTELVVSSSKEFDFNNLLNLGTLVLLDAGDLENNSEDPDSSQTTIDN